MLIRLFLGRETLLPFDDIAYLDVWWTGEINIPSSVGNIAHSLNLRADNEPWHQPLNPNPHLSIVTSLLEPHEYLGWDRDTASRTSLTSLPDVAILFRRYVESGKMINIYDWYESFSMALEDLGSQEEDENDIEIDDTPSKRKTRGSGAASLGTRQVANRANHDAIGQKRDVQARFMRSMHELAFVGFLKHTGRKADHVLKTIFDVMD